MTSPGVDEFALRAFLSLKVGDLGQRDHSKPLQSMTATLATRGDRCPWARLFWLRQRSTEPHGSFPLPVGRATEPRRAEKYSDALQTAVQEGN
jgi:hypothetical protein